HYSSYGTFCLHSKSSIISTVVLPTTEIIEPQNKLKRVQIELFFYLFFEYSIEDKKKLAQLVFSYSP
ncbi:hypothetical protein, partial [uncultured Streptococcus sp.]|uniref:hypothetical protein n=1 Tax=uncultured Streptococcus sp. TaxID=83427 RepID=UPI002605384F